MEARGVGALDASAASKLRDALLLAAAEVHADAGVVLATSPDASSALQHAWLRACPIVDGADLETHVAVALFWGLHRDERRAASATAGGYDAAERRDDAVGRNGARAKDVAVTSSFGTVRRLTALELAAAVCDAISPDARKSTLVDARPAPGDSGVIHITTRAHYEARRGAGQLRCSTCGRFVAGDRALWWHQKTRHRVHHSEAVDAVEDELRALSTTVVRSELDAGLEPSTRGSAADASTAGRKARSADDLAAGLAGGGEALDALIASGKVEALPDPGLEAARRGDVDALRRLVKLEGWDANAAVDRHGSGALLWAAGAGHLDAVKFLVEEAGTDPATTSQAGRRAYAGRTALHWAARNGHVHVMEYLVSDRGVDVDARTAEGTTAFAWACWRGRVDAMRWLVEKGGSQFGAVNAFGCNAAMWVVQGGAGLDACRYVRSLGVTFRLLNANGHSAVHKAAQRGRRDVCAWLLGRGGDDGDDGDADAIVESDAPESDAEAAWARALVGSAHLAPDNEGFTPADHARLAGDARLAAWLRARQREASARECARFIRDGLDDGNDGNDETLAAVADESRGNDSVDRRVRDASGVETTYPPATFYGAAAVGDVHLLDEILDTDPYHVNQDNGTGAPLHFAVTYGRVDAVRALLAGGMRAAVNVNQRSKAGGFGLTPLHLAATLFRKRRVAAAARADLAAAEAELASEASVDRSKTGAKEEVKAARAAEKAARKAAHRRAAAARRVLATHGAGAEEARRMYRLLLQSGADPRAVAIAPGPGGVALRVVPADLAGDDEDAAAEIASLESEATESVPEPFPRANAGDWSADLARPVARSNAAYDVDSSPDDVDSSPESNPGSTNADDDAAAKVGADDRVFEVDAAAVDPRDANRVEALFRAAAREAGSAGEVPARVDVPGVPGAFLLRRVMGKRACAALVDVVESMQPTRVGDVMTRRDSAGEGRGEKMAPRRESAAERVLRVGDNAELFDLVVTDPLALVPATDGVDGETFVPVEPVRWEVSPAALAAVAERCRPSLPEAVEGSGEPLARAGSEFATSLRCYRYLPGTASLPHYDKSTTDAETGAFSAYTVVVYLNGDEHGGGVTSFFEPVRSKAVDADEVTRASRSSKRGLTWAVGGGTAPLYKIVARVKGGTGDALFFPHGGRGAGRNPLHEGSPVTGKIPKYILRTDLMFGRD